MSAATDLVILPVSPFRLPQLAVRPASTPAMSVAARIFASPLVRATVITGLISFSAVMLSGMTLPAVVFPAVVGFGIVALGFTLCKYRYHYWYEISLTSLVVLSALNSEKWTWWNKIDEHLILGALPLRNKGHLNELVDKEHVGAVISIVDDFELTQPGISSEPVHKADWSERRIAQLHLPMPDLQPVSFDHINEAVDFIHRHKEQGITTYVHCKAGRGRSATLVICYMLRHRLGILAANTANSGKIYDRAIAYVKTKRPQIHPNEAQVTQIRIFSNSRAAA